MTADGGNKPSKARKWLDHLFEQTAVDDPVAQAAIDAFRQTDGSAKAFNAALVSFLEQVNSDFNEAMAVLDQRRQELDQQIETIREEQRAEIVAFLSEAQPGPLTDLARTVLRNRQGLMERLDWKATDLNRAILEAYGVQE